MISAKTNPKNDRIKRDYLIFLTEAKQRAKSTAEQARSAIDRYEEYTKFKDFVGFNAEQAIAFKKHLSKTNGKRSGHPISLSTIDHALHVLRDFFTWLCERQGFRRIKRADIAYLNIGSKERREANALGISEYPTLEQIKATITIMPQNTELERRDQAIMALIVATGIRDAALISLKLKHIFPAQKRVYQDPREVKTKFSKTIDTYFFPVGADIIQIISDWVKYLKEEKLFSDSDALFPKTIVGVSKKHSFQAIGISREHWANAAPVRNVFKRAFKSAGLPYFIPHSFRKTLVKLAYDLQLGPEEMKAWSQNLGHENMLTTFSNYGQLTSQRQAELILQTPRPMVGDTTKLIAEAVREYMQRGSS